MKAYIPMSGSSKVKVRKKCKIAEGNSKTFLFETRTSCADEKRELTLCGLSKRRNLESRKSSHKKKRKNY